LFYPNKEGGEFLELKLFYRTQRELASAINRAIDEYWNNNITEQEMIDTIITVHEHNPYKLLKEDGFTKIIQQHCGKRRLEVVGKIIKINKL
jgi:uncharacterized protein (TIGR04540 family)